MDAPISPRDIPRDCLEYAGIRDPDALPSLKRMDQETAARLQSAESKAHGGKTPRGGVSALAQSAAYHNKGRQYLAATTKTDNAPDAASLRARADLAMSQEAREGDGTTASAEEGSEAARLTVEASAAARGEPVSADREASRLGGQEAYA